MPSTRGANFEFGGEHVLMVLWKPNQVNVTITFIEGNKKPSRVHNSIEVLTSMLTIVKYNPNVYSVTSKTPEEFAAIAADKRYDADWFRKRIAYAKNYLNRNKTRKAK